MKHIYHLHLNGSNLEHDKVFGDCELNHRGASDINGGWHHCAPTVETLAQFVHAICHKTDCGSITINRLYSYEEGSEEVGSVHCEEL